VPKRRLFDKTNYVENYVPPEKYHRSRKPRLEQWDDPNVHWPLLLPAPTKRTWQHLISEIEQEERRKIVCKRSFLIPDFRSGDVVQFHFVRTISEGKGNTYTGVIIGRSQPNSLAAGFKVIFRFCGVEVLLNVKQHSPMLQDFKLVAKGRGQIRNKLYYLWTKRTLTADDCKKPIVKKGRTAHRVGEPPRVAHKQTASRKLKLDSDSDPLFD